MYSSIVYTDENTQRFHVVLPTQALNVKRIVINIVGI